MSSKSYQTVIAGRVREDEGIGFFGKNMIGTPAGTFDIDNKGGSAQPKIKINYLGSPNVGKPDNLRTEDKSAYNGEGYGGDKAMSV